MGAHQRSSAWGLLQEFPSAEGIRGQAEFGFWGCGVGTHEAAEAGVLGCMIRQLASQLKTGLASPCVGPAALRSCSCARLYFLGRAAAAVHASI